MIADEFNNLWHFPHCAGVLDGKHIKFRAPASEGSYYFNYKGDHSIVLMGMCDAQYRFTYVNIGVNGRVSDGGVFRESLLSNYITHNKLDFPLPSPLPGRTKAIPYVILADDAFPLGENLMKPYPQRGLTYSQKIFNYRLSRARRMIESSFGILANRFRVLQQIINLGPKKVEGIILACVALHNFLATENGVSYTEPGMVSEIPQTLPKIQTQSVNKSSNEARMIRNEFCEYFCSEIGSVSWQDDAIIRHNM